MFTRLQIDTDTRSRIALVGSGHTRACQSRGNLLGPGRFGKPMKPREVPSLALRGTRRI